MIDMESALTFVFGLGNLGIIYHFLQKMFYILKVKMGLLCHLTFIKLYQNECFMNEIVNDGKYTNKTEVYVKA